MRNSSGLDERGRSSKDRPLFFGRRISVAHFASFGWSSPCEHSRHEQLPSVQRQLQIQQGRRIKSLNAVSSLRNLVPDTVYHHGDKWMVCIDLHKGPDEV